MVILDLLQYTFEKQKVSSNLFHKYIEKVVKRRTPPHDTSCLFASEGLVQVLAKIMNTERLLNCRRNTNTLRTYMKKLRVIQRDENDNVVANYYIVN